jgi:tetratricopeptide (TPR) repeat protein
MVVFRAVPFVLIATVLAALPAAALERPTRPQQVQDSLRVPERPPEPPKDLKRPQGRTDLDRLFSLLRQAPDKDAAKALEARIWGQWAHSGSPTTDLLMARASVATEAKDTDLAVELLDAVVALAPDYVEGWNRRATLNYLRKDFAAALNDLAETLAREPRHFGALVGLGLILQDIGQDRQALDAFRQALALHPYLDRVPELIKELTVKVEGREI